VESGRELRTFSGHKKSVFSVAFSPDRKRALFGSSFPGAETWSTPAHSSRWEGTLMSELAKLFHEQETRLGVFYPTHYVVAVFRSLEMAQSACNALVDAGFSKDEARAVPGSDVLEYFDELSEQTGIWGLLMTEFSRVIDTEASFVDKDIHAARRGAGFLIVGCGTQEEAEHIHGLVAESEPIAMQWYSTGAVHSLV
jgi:WD40 repeat protein